MTPDPSASQRVSMSPEITAGTAPSAANRSVKYPEKRKFSRILPGGTNGPIPSSNAEVSARAIGRCVLPPCSRSQVLALKKLVALNITIEERSFTSLISKDSIGPPFHEASGRSLSAIDFLWILFERPFLLAENR